MKALAKKAGAWTYKPSHVAELAAVVKLGDLVYTEPPSYGVPFFDAQRGQSPRFSELQAALAVRGLRLKHEGCYYWAAVST